jgi:UDP-N-acetylglucosamine 1-carboxyvinyltransferase
MPKLIIHGGTPLKGTVKLCGAKNASYKLMIASLLCPHETRLLNFSRIADVDLVKKIIQSLGAKVYSAGERSLFINPKNLTSSTVPQDLGLASRASSMFIAPLLARTKQAIVPLPGGDKIGKRPLNRHFDGLKALGAKIEFKNKSLHASCQQLIGTTYKFPKNSHTGTETLIMAATLAQGKTIIQNAAQEPEVDDLINLLNQMGAQITRKPNRVIEIIGVKHLKSVIYQVMPDRNEAVSYAIAAYITQGDIIIENAKPDHLTAFLKKLKSAGGQFEVDGYGIRFFYTQPLKAVNITTQPHPGFMTDWQALWSVLATQSQGTSKIIEAVFTSRFQFAKDLKTMGADITFFNPQPKNPEEFYNFNLKDDNPKNQHGMKITGPTPLKGISVKVTDIRAGATLALAGLAAKDKTILTGIEHIDRGYEDFSGRLLQLGAKIKRIN